LNGIARHLPIFTDNYLKCMTILQPVSNPIKRTEELLKSDFIVVPRLACRECAALVIELRVFGIVPRESLCALLLVEFLRSLNHPLKRSEEATEFEKNVKLGVKSVHQDLA